METQKTESRMDRIERGMGEFLLGIKALKESQEKTDEQILALKASQEKTDEQPKQTDEQILRLKDSQQKTDEQLNRTEALLEKTIKKLDDIGRQLGELGLVQGEVAEDLFYRNVKSVFTKRKMTFRNVRRNLKKKGMAEYDIVAVDGEQVLVIEVKNRLDKRMVDRFVEQKLPKFMEAFPEYRSYRVIGGMGALVVKDEVGRYAERSGLYVLTQTDEGGAAILNREGFKAREFG